MKKAIAGRRFVPAIRKMGEVWHARLFSLPVIVLALVRTSLASWWLNLGKIWS
jgi:hypothetical protein